MPNFGPYQLWKALEVDPPDGLFLYIVSGIPGQGSELLDVSVHINAFKLEVLQLLSRLGVLFRVQEPPFEGVQEVCPSLQHFICLVVYLHLFKDERVHLVALDERHGESHSPFVSVEGRDTFI